MISIKHLHWTKEYFENLKANILPFCVFACLIPIIIFFNVANDSNVAWSNGTQTSLADCFIFASDILTSALFYVPAAVFLTGHLFQYDFYSNLVLRQTNRHTLWQKQTYKIFLFSLMWTIAVSFCTYIIGGFFSVAYINWGSYDSQFYYVTKATRPQISFFQVFFSFVLLTFFRVYIMCMLLQMLDWLTSRKAWGWTAIVVIGCFDWYYYPRFSIFYGKLSINHRLWCNPTDIPVGFLYAVVLLFVIWLVGFVTSSRKEFLNEG